MKFAKSVKKYGRVKFISPKNIDASTARLIGMAAVRLAKRIDAIDAEIGFTYPPIEILPLCLLPPVGDVIFAQKSFRRFKDLGFMVVQFSAPSMLAFNDEQIDAVLAHEFLHYVWSTVDAVKNLTGEEANGFLVSDGLDPHPDYWNSLDTYEMRDQESQTLDSDWLPDRLVQLQRRLLGPDKRLFIDYSRITIFQEWLRKGFPTETIDPSFRYRGPLTIDEAIITRAKELGLIRAK